jgi:hypothetical protein
MNASKRSAKSFLSAKSAIRKRKALQDAKPLFNLIHPGTMNRRVMKDKSRMQGFPCLNLLAFMHTQVIQY